MKKRDSNLKIRVAFEPNRFSSECLVKVYEQLKPIDSRIISNDSEKEEQAETIATREGGKNE